MAAAVSRGAEIGTAGNAATSSAHAAAPVDLTGYWVSVATQDWRFRMVVPGKGEYAGIPINLTAKEFADSWSPAADEAAGQECKAYGVGAIMQVPERLHIIWQDENTLRVETDAGNQKRLLRFKPSAAEFAGPLTTQGLSIASWVPADGSGRGQSDPPIRGPGTELNGRSMAKASGGTLKVSTSRMSAGYLRKNGVPYSTDMTMTEYWDVHRTEDGVQWLTIPTELDDPRYLQSPYDFAPIFKRETDGSHWDPSPCSLRW